MRATRRAQDVLTETPASPAPALTQTHRNRTEDSIMNGETGPITATTPTDCPDGAFPLVERETGGSPVERNRPFRPSGRQDLNLRPRDPQALFGRVRAG